PRGVRSGLNVAALAGSDAAGFAQVVGPIGRAYGDVAQRTLVQHLEADRASGGADLPDVTVELGLVGKALVVDRDDDVAYREAGLLGRPVAREPRHDQVAAHVLGRQPEPGLHRAVATAL